MSAINSLTGTVIDSGDGVTHVVPICDGYVLGSQIKHIPIAGKRITKFMMEMIKDRGENINVEDLYFATMEIKEKYGYVAKDLVQEFTAWDEKIYDENKKTYSGKKYKNYQGVGRITGKDININVGYETFLGPESFFSPVYI
jgi:actin-related protein 3